MIEQKIQWHGKINTPPKKTPNMFRLGRTRRNKEEGRVYNRCVTPRTNELERDSGIKDRDERLRGREILMSYDFVKIKPTEPFRLCKQTEWMNRNYSDSSGSSLGKTDVSRCSCKKIKWMKSSLIQMTSWPLPLEHHLDQEHRLNALSVWSVQ